MFSNVGFGEILVLLIVGFLLIGPERLPGLIKEVQAIILAIRNAVGQAKEQLDGEFGDEFKQFSKPLAELNNVRQMGARGFITKTLLDGDDTFLTSLDSTKKDVKGTVDTVRKANVRDTLRGATTSPKATQQASEPAVPVQQQAAAGESTVQESPIQNTAQDMVQDLSHAEGQGKLSSGDTTKWDDVV